MPMDVMVRKWEKNQNTVSVERGPLTFSLKIGERWTRYGKNEAWPEWEVFPTTPWNYGLDFDPTGAKSLKEDLQFGPKNRELKFAESIQTIKKTGPLPANPFTPETTPIELRVTARRIPAWEQDKFGLVGKLQPSPAKSEEPVETVSLIPMGAARLRITAFPMIGHRRDAHQWSTPRESPIYASHCFESDSVDAIFDGIEPRSSSDARVPRFTWRDHRSTAEWVEWGFSKPRRISAAEIYWVDDTGKGGCRVPQSWKLFYRVGERWLPVEGPAEFGVQRDTYNRVNFKPVEAEGLRINVQLQPNFSGGILEWKVSE
jgi:hypothetical protein